MKYSNISFLFFNIFLTLFFCGIPKTSYTQQSIDSIKYFYKAIINPENPEHLPNGIRYYSRKKVQDLAKEDTLNVIQDLRMLAIGEFKIGNIYDSENSIVEALNLIDGLRDKDTLIGSRIGLYNQLGRIYRASNNYKAAINAFDEALKISKKLKDSIIILNNKANIYKDMEEYKLAIDQYSILYEKSLKLNNELQLTLVLDNLGSVQSKIFSPKALGNLNKALKIRVEENYLAGMYSSYRNLAYYYLEREDKTKALFYANKGLDVAEKINSSSYIQNALSLFMKLNDDSKVREYQRLMDSISKARQLAENKNAFIKYNLGEERKKTEASKLIQEKEKRKRLTYQSISAIILMALIASYFVFRYRYKKGKIEEVYKTEARISKRVHDEVANDVYHVMTKLQSNSSNNESVLDDLEKIYSKTRDISKDNSAIDVGKNFEQLLNDLLLSYKTQDVNIVTKNLSKINWDNVSLIKKTTIYRVLQELMTNMRKYSEASLVALSFNRSGNKISIDYKDNGIGCLLKKKNGLQNAENRIASINGTISFESKLNEGFKSKIIV